MKGIIQSLTTLEQRGHTDEYKKDFEDNDEFNDNSSELVEEALDYLKSFESLKDTLYNGVKNNLSLTVAQECIDIFIDLTQKRFKLTESTRKYSEESNPINIYLQKIEDIKDQLKLLTLGK
jgi:hypothetical protein